jgi:hypothetical protein
VSETDATERRCRVCGKLSPSYVVVRRGDQAEEITCGQCAVRSRKPFDYPEAWSAFWFRHRGEHSMLRCPGDPCPGGCGANAKDNLAAIQDARRGLDLTDTQRRRIGFLLHDWNAHLAGERERKQRGREVAAWPGHDWQRLDTEPPESWLRVCSVCALRATTNSEAYREGRCPGGLPANPKQVERCEIESVDVTRDGLKIRGRVLKADEPNANARIYPKPIVTQEQCREFARQEIEREVQRFERGEVDEEKRAVAEVMEQGRRERDAFESLRSGHGHQPVMINPTESELLKVIEDAYEEGGEADTALIREGPVEIENEPDEGARENKQLHYTTTEGGDWNPLTFHSVKLPDDRIWDSHFGCLRSEIDRPTRGHQLGQG